jgi:hypothetical protein
MATVVKGMKPVRAREELEPSSTWSAALEPSREPSRWEAPRGHCQTAPNDLASDGRLEGRLSAMDAKMEQLLALQRLILARLDARDARPDTELPLPAVGDRRRR